MNTVYLGAAIAAAVLLAYLVVALFKAEDL